MLEIGDGGLSGVGLRDAFPKLVEIVRRVLPLDAMGMIIDADQGRPPLVHITQDNDHASNAEDDDDDDDDDDETQLVATILQTAHAYFQGEITSLDRYAALVDEGEQYDAARGGQRQRQRRRRSRPRRHWICLPLTRDDLTTVGLLGVASLDVVDEGTVAFIAYVARHLARRHHHESDNHVHEAEESKQRVAAQRLLLAEERIARTAAESAVKANATFGDSLALIFASSHSRTMVDALSRSMSLHFTCGCAIDIQSEDGSLVHASTQALAPMHRERDGVRDATTMMMTPTPAPLPSALLASSLAPLVVQIVRHAHATATGLPVLRADDLILVEAEQLRRTLDADWLISVPIILNGHARGAITVFGSSVSYHERPMHVHDVEQLARRLGAALDAVHLHSKTLRAVHARDQVLSTVSHDLKNPLAVILFSTELMLDKMPLRERRQVEVIQRNARRMKALVTDLLDFGAMEAGALSMSPTSCDSRCLIRDAVDETMIEAAARVGISLSVDMRNDDGGGGRREEEEETFPRVWADSNRVLQVLTNLLANAIKFTPSGGHITVRKRLLATSREVAIEVEDTGIGIAPEELAHVFERYWQSRKKTTEDVTAVGSGLGLAICKVIIELSRGRIWVESRRGYGTIVTFTLPIESDGGP